MRKLTLLASLAVPTVAHAANLFNFTGATPSLRAAALDTAFGATQMEGKREPTALPYASTLKVTHGVTSSTNQISLTDSRISVAFQHAFDGFNGSFAASVGDLRFKPTVDLHYQAGGTYAVTAPNAVPVKIDQDFSLTGDTSQPQVFFGTNQGQSTAAGTTTYTAGIDAGTSHVWLGKRSGTLFAGVQYTLSYQNYIQGGAAGVPDGTTASGSVAVDLFYRGDLNGDRAIDFTDLVAMAQHYNATVGPDGYAKGDIDGDGMVTFVDLVILAQGYNTSIAPPAVNGASAAFNGDAAAAFDAVPEPLALTPLSLAAAGLTRPSRRPRRR